MHHLRFFNLFALLQAYAESVVLPNHFNINLLNTPKSLSPYLRFGCLSVRKFYWALNDTYEKVNEIFVHCYVYRTFNPWCKYLPACLPSDRAAVKTTSFFYVFCCRNQIFLHIHYFCVIWGHIKFRDTGIRCQGISRYDIDPIRLSAIWNRFFKHAFN